MTGSHSACWSISSDQPRVAPAELFPEPDFQLACRQSHRQQMVAARDLSSMWTGGKRRTEAVAVAVVVCCSVVGSDINFCSALFLFQIALKQGCLNRGEPHQKHYGLWGDEPWKSLFDSMTFHMSCARPCHACAAPSEESLSPLRPQWARAVLAATGLSSCAMVLSIMHSSNVLPMHGR